MMCKVNYFFCVNEDYPEMVRNQAYNNCQVPSLPGIEVFRFEDIFEGLEVNDSHYIEVSIPSDGKLTNKDGKLFADRFIFIDKSKFTGANIQWMIESGARVDVGLNKSGLIDWAIANNTISTLNYLASKCKHMTKTMYNYINKFVTESKYNTIIQTLIKSGYDIHKDNDSIFLFAAANKNTELCRFLLKEGCNIPKQVSIMYSTNKGTFPAMDRLLEEYNDRIIE